MHKIICLNLLFQTFGKKSLGPFFLEFSKFYIQITVLISLSLNHINENDNISALSSFYSDYHCSHRFLKCGTPSNILYLTISPVF